MILYNIRANGPFEYDKFILNIGQLHNEYNQTKNAYRNSVIKQSESVLNNKIQERIQPIEIYGNDIYKNWIKDQTCTEDNFLQHLVMIKETIL